MQYTTNPISEQELLSSLNKKFGKGDWSQMFSNSTYSLVANIVKTELY